MARRVVPTDALVNERTTGVDVPTFGDFQQGRLGSKLSARHQELNSLTKGASLQRFTGKPPSGNGVLQQMRTRNTTPDAPQIFHVTEHKTNTVHTINRNIMQQAPMFGSPHPYELLIMFKNPERRTNSVYVPHSGLMVECEPLESFTPAVFNYIETMRQQEMFENDATRDAYKRLSPSDIWKHYVIEGVIETEAKPTGNGQYGPQFTRMFLDGGSSGSSGNFDMQSKTTIDGSKLCTVSAKGPQFVYNYCGANITSGGKVVAIIKKYPQPLDFVLRREGGVVKALESFVSLEQKRSFRPFLMGFYCLPPGTRYVPRELLEYIDDDGNKHFDGLPISIGTVFSVPPDHCFKTVDMLSVKPWTTAGQSTNAYESTHQMMIIFDTAQGGYPL